MILSHAIARVLPAILLSLGLAGCATTGSGDGAQTRNPELRLDRDDPARRPAPFDKVLLAPVVLEFRVVPPLAGPSSTYGSRTEFPIGEEERAELARIFDTILREELAASERVLLTDTAGPGVLVIRPALRDIVSRVPPEEPAGRSRVYVDTVGEATLVVEFVDGATGAPLGTATDRREAQPAGTTSFGAVRATPVETGREVRLLARRWARSLERRIEQLYFEAKPR